MKWHECRRRDADALTGRQLSSGCWNIRHCAVCIQHLLWGIILVHGRVEVIKVYSIDAFPAAAAVS